MAAARVREACGIPGTSTRTAYLCRDKPAMKEVLRAAGVRCAASTGARSGNDVRDFAAAVGFPLVLKPAAGAGASGAERVNAPDELEEAIARSGVDHGTEIAVEEFVEGHEGFYDTISIDGHVAMDFATHYYPNVLEAMRTRWISPQFVATNRIDSERGYDELKDMGRAVIHALGIGTSATHMEWFAGPKGLYFSEIGCRPPGVRCWDLYAAGNDIDIYGEWAMAVVHGRTSRPPSRRFAAGIVALRPERDGTISGYDGVDEIQSRHGEWVIDAHLPPAGTPTQPVEAGYMANAWIRLRHPDYDELRTCSTTSAARSGSTREQPGTARDPRRTGRSPRRPDPREARRPPGRGRAVPDRRRGAVHVRVRRPGDRRPARPLRRRVPRRPVVRTARRVRLVAALARGPIRLPPRVQARRGRQLRHPPGRGPAQRPRGVTPVRGQLGVCRTRLRRAGVGAVRSACRDGAAHRLQHRQFGPRPRRHRVALPAGRVLDHAGRALPARRRARRQRLPPLRGGLDGARQPDRRRQHPADRRRLHPTGGAPRRVRRRSPPRRVPDGRARAAPRIRAAAAGRAARALPGGRQLRRRRLAGGGVARARALRPPRPAVGIVRRRRRRAAGRGRSHCGARCGASCRTTCPIRSPSPIGCS